MNPLDFFDALGDCSLSNLDNTFFSILTVIAGYIVVKLVAREINSLRSQNRLEQHAAYTMNRILKSLVFLIVLSIILAQFGIELGTVSGLLTLFGGTIIGFAAINTRKYNCWFDCNDQPAF
jgi:small-conductance mechanosensitive channel